MPNIRSSARAAERSHVVAGIRRGLLAAAAVLTLVIATTFAPVQHGASSLIAASVAAPARDPTADVRFADFGTETVSQDARHLADWVADSRDNASLDFIIIDKKHARLHVFDGVARLQASAPVLLGAARGDDAVPGIGTRPIAEVRAEERTTHAGRFVAERGRNADGEDVVWVDYDAAVSMHRVRIANPKDRRLERLATPTADDNRISYGCINVPVAFYEAYIRPTFATHRAIVYVLPETRSVQQVFGSYDVAALRHLAAER